MRALRATLSIAVLAAALAGCGGSSSSSSSSNGSASSSSGGQKAVSIKGFAFAPADLTVAKGTKVVFTNGDSTNHTATATDSSAFDTGTVAPGRSKAITLSKPGTYTYFCSFHPFMKGQITVQP